MDYQTGYTITSSTDDHISLEDNTCDLQQDETTPAGLHSGNTEPASSQANNDGDLFTRPYDLKCKKDGDDDYIDDESSPTEGDAADEIAPTVDSNHGDAHIVPHQVTYTCQDHMVCFKTVSEESETTESCVEQNNTDKILTNMDGCDPIKNDAKINTVENAGNTVNTPHCCNLLYPLTKCLQNDQSRNQMYAQNATNSETPNPMYAQNAINCTSVYKPKACDSNPMYAPDLPLHATESDAVEATAEDLNPKVDTDIEAQASRDTEAEQSATRQTDTGESFNITPYAVRYQTDDDNDDIVTRSNIGTRREQTQSSFPGNADIEPYAVRYEDDEDLAARRNAAKNERTQGISPDDVHIEPYAVAYTGGDDDTSTRSERCSSTTHGTVLGGNSDARGVRDQAPMHVQNGPQQNFGVSHDNNDNSQKVVLVGKEENTIIEGRSHRGVAVSADNEIFVTDFQKRRVHVYNMSGAYRRFFRTIVPGVAVRKMQPSDVAVDGEGHLWVVGKRKNINVKAHVVQYRRNGQPLFTFDVNFVSVNPGIAFDATNHKVIVSSMRGVLIYQSNGSLHLRFEERRKFPVSYVTTDSEGNIFVSTPGEIQVYNRYGARLFTFRTLGLEGRSGIPRGICLDTLGRIIVTKVLPARVDMYTSRGGFVRTIANITNPAGVAMGPDGQLVVANAQLRTVTIFPRQLVYMSDN
uniref:SMP-30/Gluconolactonase/LRE-like region domain-containing protein n=1 Tax=Branchiostoma floridae TaxID=7739 RepID=C3Y4W9_BRAFL|eukprot:XP_002608766.1 hypothetical protein BRAFLDRAFT_73992 [Branchiostoma floridae]